MVETYGVFLTTDGKQLIVAIELSSALDPQFERIRDFAEIVRVDPDTDLVERHDPTPLQRNRAKGCKGVPPASATPND